MSEQELLAEDVERYKALTGKTILPIKADGTPLDKETVERAINALCGHGYVTDEEAKKVNVTRVILEKDLVSPDKTLPYILQNKPGFRKDRWERQDSAPFICNQCGEELPLNESWLYAGRRFCYEHYSVVKEYCERNEIKETDLKYKGEY